jgi:general stress protein 26
MFTTLGENGEFHARPMTTAFVDFNPSEGTEVLYFVSHRDTHKVSELRRDNKACLAFCKDTKGEWASVSVHVNIIEDRDRMHEMFRTMKELRTYFPEGVDDPNLQLLECFPTEGHFWDMSSVKDRMKVMFGSIASKIPGMKKAISPPTGHAEAIRM